MIAFISETRKKTRDPHSIGGGGGLMKVKKKTIINMSFQRPGTFYRRLDVLLCTTRLRFYFVSDPRPFRRRFCSLTLPFGGRRLLCSINVKRPFLGAGNTMSHTQACIAATYC